MDSDLERIARGIGVSAETAEAATTVLAKTDVGEAATTIGPAAVTSTTYTPGAVLRVRRTAAQANDLAVASRGRCWSQARWSAAGSPIRRCRISSVRAKPVAVPDVKGVEEQLAVQKIRAAGLEELVQREPNADVEVGIVSEQDPQPGDRTEKGNFVTIIVSTGPQKIDGAERRRPEP